MQGCADHLPDRCLAHVGKSELRRDTPDADRLAALAALTLSRQSPGLLLPNVVSAPTSHTRTEGTDKALVLARSLVQLGLGSLELWKRHGANCSLFVRDALNEWLQSLGAPLLKDRVELDFAIVEELEDNRADGGKLFILVETSGGCGSLFVGQAIEQLESEQEGLGRAFYIVLAKTMNLWMDVYDRDTTRYFLERWKESIEMEMEETQGSPEAFAEYCKRQDINFPDLDAGIPISVRSIRPKEYLRLRPSLALLRKHRNGRFAEWIEPVLAIAQVRKRSIELDEDIQSIWDDGPLPNWVLAFQPNDVVMQTFDEEAQAMYESSHAPTWLDTFNPCDPGDVRRVLSHVRDLVAINLKLVSLSNSLERSRKHARTDRPHVDDELRAA